MSEPWPSKGRVEFRGVVLSYRDELEPALRLFMRSAKCGPCDLK